jgi:hypothetical protein
VVRIGTLEKMSGVRQNMMDMDSMRSVSQCPLSAVKMIMVRQSGVKNNVIAKVRDAVITVLTADIRAIS